MEAQKLAASPLISSLIALLLAELSVGCALNVRLAQFKDGIFGRANRTPLVGCAWSYYAIGVGTAAQGPTILPDIWIEYENGSVVRLRDIDESWLAKHFSGERYAEFNDTYSDGEFRDVVFYGDRGLWFLCSGGRIVQFSAHEYGGSDLKHSGPAVLWNAGRTRRFQFPLGERGTAELFGPLEKTWDSFEW